MAAWKDLGRDLTGLFGESGVDFRDSIAQREEDELGMTEHGLGDNPSSKSVQMRDANFVARVAAAKSHIEAAGIDDITWPAVIAASGAISAPGAFLQGMAGAAAVGDPANSNQQNSVAAVVEAPTNSNSQDGQDEPATDPNADPDAGLPEEPAP